MWPLVIVPNVGIPATVFADVDMKLRSHPVLGQLGKNVTSPGILIYRELQVFEGLCQHRFARGLRRRTRTLAPRVYHLHANSSADVHGRGSA
jgi:hypothetical protein